jgi:hypothetical protein
MTKQLISRIDKAGMIASLVCAVHCILSPSLMVAIQLHGVGQALSEDAEWLFVGVSIMLGMLSFLPSYIRFHRRSSALTTFAVGAGIIFLGRLIAPFGHVEAVLVVMGALMIAVAHIINRLLCRSCPRCTQSTWR